ncbi:Holliday junction resolvase [Pseudooceanicola batsensis HTCC2597]|uniref:Holliday junction resolvase n=1 Tax=Pseudooceanicola batsensis (strain ATCC BAA-863 / DSM 15984 / KCTC 12145 / HTCC2597) TaxID=252305 RepID=A3TZ05_PSEBH|nr:DUF1127 domain-containing protein [Pseudooceanicola batsensis]EAQ02823.1 Holliday junction resolvase [Pseudooceanicola batsensis HTCC2597]
MSVYTMKPRPQTAYVETLGHIGRALSNLHLALRDWNDRRVTRRILGGLTDRELSDIGLLRSEIGDLR